MAGFTYLCITHYGDDMRLNRQQIRKLILEELNLTISDEDLGYDLSTLYHRALGNLHDNPSLRYAYETIAKAHPVLQQMDNSRGEFAQFMESVIYDKSVSNALLAAFKRELERAVSNYSQR